jgi:hypothetical protein
MNRVLDLSPRLTLLPIIHGSADFALQVRRQLWARPTDCVAVPLPPSFADAVEEGIEQFPRISLALQRESSMDGACTVVPVDPCQGVIAALREAMERDLARAYIDLEVAEYEPYGLVLPDAYALKGVSLEQFAAAVVPFLPAPDPDGQQLARIRRMAYELHCLELEHEHVTCVCSMVDWPWLRDAYRARSPYLEHQHGAHLAATRAIAESQLFLVLGELPFITGLYEHRRAELLQDASLAIDGAKALLLEARAAWHRDSDTSHLRLTPQALSVLLTYVRNLTLMDRRLTPELYNLALAAKQVVGDDFALALVETARRYPPQRLPAAADPVRLGVDTVDEGDGHSMVRKNRLQGVPRVWRRLPLRPNPRPQERREWTLQWNPFGQCSYPPEDQRIESFQRHVREQARLLVGDSEAKTEKFSASLKDGLDSRETLRNWHSGDLYVRELPPARGDIEIVVFLFEQDPDPLQFPWRSTWYAEHGEESTLCFFATNFMGDMVGPGIGQARYGGCFFIFPPRPIPDVWTDDRLETSSGLGGRLVAGALLHSRERRVVLVAPAPPPASWRRLARRLRRQLVHIPLQRFSSSTIERLRHFHVLNGRNVRSYAARFIRDMR